MKLTFLTNVDQEELENKITEVEQSVEEFVETDPTVPAWAKAETKPTYTASEVTVDTNSWNKNKLDNVGVDVVLDNVLQEMHADNIDLNSRFDMHIHSFNSVSVNGHVLNGKITLTASEVGALSEDSLPTAINTALAQAKASGEFDGKTPVKGVDYWTAADQESIVQQVIAALGTPVFGRVDADNNIILTGELADGTYTLKYEDAEGNLLEIGELDMGGIENLADPTSADWVENKRINSSGSLVVADAGGNMGMVNAVTNFIPCKAGDVVRVKGVDIAYYQTSATDTGRTNMFYYKSDKSTVVNKIVVADNPSIFVNSGDTWTFTVGNGVSGDTSTIAYIRPFGRYMSGYTKNDVIITVNEEIK